MTSDLIGEARRARNELHERVERDLSHVAQQHGRLRNASRTRKSAETRKKIMGVTSRLMVERGNTTFQMSEVSRRCGMSKGALYYYFSDKDDLVNAIYEAELDELVNGIDEAVAAADTPVDALRGACNVFARLVREGTPLAMAVVRELVVSNERDVATPEMHIAHIVGVVARQLELARDEGSISGDVNIELIAVAVCGAFTFAAMGGAGQTDDDFAEQLFGFVVNGIAKPA